MTAAIDILGVGIWSDSFADWDAFKTGIRTGAWQSDAPLQPGRIAPRDRRRAPKPVKLAIEVMSQACEMANMEPASIATVFCSAMGDMDITDYMCGTLAAAPLEISPTRFHNSVHNAPLGYWSIGTKSHAPASAVSAHHYTAPTGFLEAAVQALEENTAVLLVTQEIAAPLALENTCPTHRDFAAAFLLSPSTNGQRPMTSVRFDIRHEVSRWPGVPRDLESPFLGHPGAGLLALLAALAAPQPEPIRLAFPLSAGSSLELSLWM